MLQCQEHIPESHILDCSLWPTVSRLKHHIDAATILSRFVSCSSKTLATASNFSSAVIASNRSFEIPCLSRSFSRLTGGAAQMSPMSISTMRLISLSSSNCGRAHSRNHVQNCANCVGIRGTSVSPLQNKLHGWCSLCRAAKLCSPESKECERIFEHLQHRLRLPRLQHPRLELHPCLFRQRYRADGPKHSVLINRLYRLHCVSPADRKWAAERFPLLVNVGTMPPTVKHGRPAVSPCFSTISLPCRGEVVCSCVSCRLCPTQRFHASCLSGKGHRPTAVRYFHSGESVDTQTE